MKTLARIWLALLLLAAAAPSFASEAPGLWPVWDVGFLFGGSLSDGDLAGGDYGIGEIGPAFGVRGAHHLTGRVNWFADAVTSTHDTELTSGSAKRVAARTGVEVFIGRRGASPLFFSGAAGYEKVDFESQSLDLERPLASLGVGQRFQLRNGTFFRWELRGEHLIGDDGVGGNTVDNAELLVGWSFGGGTALAPAPRSPGEAKPQLAPPAATPPPGAAAPVVVPAAAGRHGRDSDGDGVPDKDDRCAFTPKGYPVDAHGCATDSDGDGVPDGADQCPNTPAKAWVDAKGCPTDFDHDGVVDGVDRCPDTPEGTKVDEFGCPVPE